MAQSGKTLGGRQAGYGRQKGTPNKHTTQLKEIILTALHDEGGAKYLRWLSRENPGAFAMLLGKVLPLTVVGDVNNPLTLIITTGVPDNHADDDEPTTYVLNS